MSRTIRTVPAWAKTLRDKNSKFARVLLEGRDRPGRSLRGAPSAHSPKGYERWLDVSWKQSHEAKKLAARLVRRNIHQALHKVLYEPDFDSGGHSREIQDPELLDQDQAA